MEFEHLAEELRNDLARLGELTDEEITALREKLGEVIDRCRNDLTLDHLLELDDATNATVALKETMKTREDEQEERQSKAAEMLARIEEPAPDAPAEGETPPADAAKPEGEEAPADEAAADKPDTRLPVAAGASRPTVATIASRRPESMAPREANPRLSVVAAGDVPHFSAGQAFPSWDAVGEGFADKVQTLAGSKGLASRYGIATFKLDYPEDRRLTSLDPTINTRRVQDVYTPILAAGGLCAPVDAYYDLAQISAADRPIRDSLPRFQANRGGIRFITPPTLAQATPGVGITTATQDAAGYPPTATKPIVTITCGTETTVTTQAISLRIQVGNFSRNTFPEQFEAWHANALAAHARVAEGALLDAISGSSQTLALTEGQILGASRDLLEQVGKVAAQFRNRFRMSPTATLQAFFPVWVLDMIREDVNRQHAGDGLEARAVPLAQIQGWFKARGVEVTWYEDTRTGAGQVFGTQVAGAVLPWITTVEWYLAHPGSFIYLDGGTLDLGIEIRDSTLIGTNDVQAFMETFEGLAVVGISPLRVRSTVCVSGAGSLDIAVTCPGTGS